MNLVDRFRGSMLGLAIGDALGHPTEFVASVAAIRARWGPEGVTDFEAVGKHPPGTFTDDTQMAIAVARALCRESYFDIDVWMHSLGEEFIAWSRSAQNNRAPGGTCLAGCRNLARGAPWRTAGVKGSKGCGAAIRAAPVGMLLHRDDVALVHVAAAQSACTHAHPTAIASSVAAAAAVAAAMRGEPPAGVIPYVRERVASIEETLLLDLGCTPALVERVGVLEMLEALDRCEAQRGVERDDVCELLGGAWVGEEAVVGALWCVLRAEGDYSNAVLRGANSAGDSDALASIAGAIAGAYGGIEAIPSRWVERVEKADVLDLLACSLCEAHTHGAPIVLDPRTDVFGAGRLAVRPEDLIGDDDTEVDRAPDALRSLRETLKQRN